MHCSNCKAKVNPGDKKCPNCGATLIWNNKKNQPLKTKNTKEKVKDKQEDEIFCPECGKIIKKNTVICPHCGAQIKELKIKNSLVTPKNIFIEKRPISILLVILLGIPFLITFSSTLTFNRGTLAIITHFPIFIIITFILIFVNLGKNKSRTNGFILATCIMVVILIGASISYSVMSKNTQDTTIKQEAAQTELTDKTVKGSLESSASSVKDSTIQLEETNNEIAEAIVLTGRDNKSTDFFYILGGHTFIDFSGSGFFNPINVDVMDENGNLVQNIRPIISSNFYEVLYLNEGKYFLNVETDGTWEAVIKQYMPQTRNLPYIFIGNSSNLSDFIVIDGLVEINYSYKGSGNFIVYILNEYGEHKELIASEIGSTSGSTTFKGSGNKYLVSVERADGNYQINIEYK